MIGMIGRSYDARYLCLQRTTENVPRISACLCQLTTELYSRGFGRPLANFSEFGEVPVAMFSPMFSSVVRRGYRLPNGVMVNMHPQLILINILVDNVLHVRDKVTPLDQIWTYYLASYNSGVLLDSARIEQCNIFGVCRRSFYKCHNCYQRKMLSKNKRIKTL